MGIAYFSSAGNSSRHSYEVPFDPNGTQIVIGASEAGEAHDFDPGPGVDIFQHVTIPGGGTLIVSLQWDSPYFSLSGRSDSLNDSDIFIPNPDKPELKIED